MNALFVPLFPPPFSDIFLPWLARNYSNPTVSLFLYLYNVFIWIMDSVGWDCHCPTNVFGVFFSGGGQKHSVCRPSFLHTLATKYVYEYSNDPENTHTYTLTPMQCNYIRPARTLILLAIRRCSEPAVGRQMSERGRG